MIYNLEDYVGMYKGDVVVNCQRLQVPNGVVSLSTRFKVLDVAQKNNKITLAVQLMKSEDEMCSSQEWQPMIFPAECFVPDTYLKRACSTIQTAIAKRYVHKAQITPSAKYNPRSETYFDYMLLTEYADSNPYLFEEDEENAENEDEYDGDDDDDSDDDDIEYESRKKKKWFGLFAKKGKNVNEEDVDFDEKTED